MKTIKSIIISYDFLIAVLITIALYFVLPNYLKNVFAKDIYSVGLSILSIIFSVFFAALAIIVSSSDDEFVNFLEKDNLFSEIVYLYKFVLLELLIALFYTFVIFSFTSFQIANKIVSQGNIWFLIFSFFFSYGILAVFSTSLNSIKYATKRSEFLASINSNGEK